MKSLHHGDTKNISGASLKDDLYAGTMSVDFDRLFPAMRRQVFVAVAVCSLAVLAGVAWILVAVPRYTADVLILIDNKRIRAVEDSV